MDPIMLALINKSGNSLESKVNSILTGIKNYSTDGLVLKFETNDGQQFEIEYPSPVPVKDVELQKDDNANTHLIITMDDSTRYDCGKIPAGLSAYEIAVEVEGFEGSEAEWLATLPGRRQPIRFDFGAAAEWRVQHNQNDQYVSCRLFDEDGNAIQADIEYYSPNLLIVRFDVPVAGYIIIN